VEQFFLFGRAIANSAFPMEANQMLYARVSIAILLVLCANVVAQATTITVSEQHTCIIPLTTTDWDDSVLSFPMFNSELGELTSVTLDLTGSYDTDITVTNTSTKKNSKGTVSVAFEFDVQDGTGHSLALLGLAPLSFDFNLASNGIVRRVENDEDTAHWDYSGTETMDIFMGTGTITLPAFTTTQTNANYSGGNAYVSQDTSAALTGTVTYTYSSTRIPEPGACVLLAIGVLGTVAFYSRRRRS
jgi:hypothetical protein